MRKTISSLFILMLLLISLWGFSSWSYGINNKKDIDKILNKKNTVFANNFDYEVLEVEHSVFGSNIKVGIDLSSFSFLTAMGFKTENIVIFNIEMYNGPLLIDKSGVNVGRSIWHISLDDKLIDNQWFNNYILSNLYTLTVYVNFENQIKYKTNHQSNMSQVSLVGEYDSKESIGFAEITINNFLHTFNQNTIKFDETTIAYDHSSNALATNKIKLKLNSPKVSYQHKQMSAPYHFKLNGSGSLSIGNNYINNKSKIFLDQFKSHNYPFDQIVAVLGIKQLSLENFYTLLETYEKMNDLINQREWVLEEQTETPEGQDKLWQLNDDSLSLKVNLPFLSEALLLKNKEPNIRFTLDSKFQGEPSILIGSIVPQTVNASFQDSYSINNNYDFTTFWSLFKVQANVSLGESLLDYITKHLPIHKSNFELRYEYNKLLMQ